MLSLRAKEQEVRAILARSGRAAVAFSGGADSSLLLRLALDVLGPDQVLALTVSSCLLPARELERVRSWPGRHGLREQVKQAFLAVDPLAWDEFAANPADRCYHCKSRVYRILLDHARQRGMETLFDGTNDDDLHSDRPGLRALRELCIVTPLALAGLSKAEVRALSRELGLDTWDAPSASCLATRIPAGLAITQERLARIASLEAHLEQLGYRGCRVRLDGQADIFYVQVREKDLPRLAGGPERAALLDFFNNSGAKKVYLDLRGR